MIIEVSALSRISVSTANNEDSIHLEIAEGRDCTHHLYVHPDNSIHIHYKQASNEKEEKAKFKIFVHY